MAKSKVIKDNAERYLLTYADLMNLLLILFIILFAYSQVDTQKFQQLSQSLGAAFGNGSTPSVVSGGASGNSLINFPATMPSPVIPSNMEDAQYEAAEDAISGLIEAGGMGGDVSVQMTERGILMSIDATLAFKSGSAELEREGRDRVLAIGKTILSKMPDKHIRIEGHTDNVPINSARFPSNWELSGSRSTNVLRLLVDQAGLNSKLVSAVAYGDSMSLVPNNSDANRAKNRRVDIVILRDSSSIGEASTDYTNNTNTNSK
ncbi:chemotaxis protein MotB [Ruminiclostridium sufflavum DSM 19573]|uniref:Chemotaxis protein MotB n=1 Tax=Ruminiclostridium sufflavum DSM 19573 TaxID=1121337 RepID=A0A318XP42_9FIRM|nr:flagellar motor protein MotB [Ruminiclostridium sufflavum]PYG89536.1 chemotaxis protein MotB [Ruminiclostridium sufflavum DSM 19573]